MVKRYLKQTSPFRVPAGGGKVIDEHFGLASTKTPGFSIARMSAPAGWSEPAQSPDFDEVTIMLSGRARVEIDGEAVELGPGETILVRKGARMRYSNPYAEPAEYWAVCIPAFSPDTVHRE